MSEVYTLEARQAEKKAKEIRSFLLELDSICDKLYNRLQYAGVWESLMALEDVRVRYYVEYYEYNQLAARGNKRNDK